MKIAILGAGMIVSDLLPIVKDFDNIDFTAIFGAESDKEKMAEFVENYGIGSIFYDYDALLSSDIADTIYVALPNFLHYPFAKKALEAGKNVIVEKPFTSNLQEFTELETLAKAKKLFLFEAITNQYLKNYEAIKADLPTIGDVKIVACNYSQYSSRYDLFKAGTILPAFNPAMSGGALMDLNIYNIHFVVGLFGKPEKVDYLANIAHGIDTSGILMLDYGHLKAICIGAKDCAAPVASTIQGDKGTIRVEGPSNTVEAYSYILNKQAPIIKDVKSHEHRMFDEFVAFEKMIATDDFDEMTARLANSRIVMTIIEQAKASANLVFGADQK
ncbi:NAD(P)-dependent oxidoreductase [Lactococcus hodotermopsidis]|uniref:NAD(P)-dependent oxidoreductase n=1 Tax=Pseudolactococcus hodotermopsidis TaxID=2709157 RepID=A0A6A0BCR3_9LACT|nr:Gfo/Idh/MocA family oxidoreductase [Lactococcus hodotermopsidis]GFH43190.1 NAD(P)-dependent oxidoreductase [Lactococcus hodotermopsidis]